METLSKRMDVLINRAGNALSTSNPDNLKLDNIFPESESESEAGKTENEYPQDIRYDVALSRFRRFLSAFNDFKQDQSEENGKKLQQFFNELREIYVCSGCEELYGAIEELLPEARKGTEGAMQVMESYVEGLTIAIEGTNIMREKWGTVKPLEDLSDEEKQFLEKEAYRRMGIT